MNLRNVAQSSNNNSKSDIRKRNITIAFSTIIKEEETHRNDLIYKSAFFKEACIVIFLRIDLRHKKDGERNIIRKFISLIRFAVHFVMNLL